MIISNDDEFVKVLKSIRSHGWARDLGIETQKAFSNEFGINSFRGVVYILLSWFQSQVY